MKNQSAYRRSGLKIMGQLIGLVRPLLHIMLVAVILGTAGYLCAIFLSIMAGKALLQGMVPEGGEITYNLFAVMGVLAVLRGVFHYAEQYCNHFIAFKLLAMIRHEVFTALRKLCPAKLEGQDKGNLISIITTDIELLEVFYAHTISPIAIASATSVIMVLFLIQYHISAGILALAGYASVGVLIPVWNGRRSGVRGMEFRTEFGELNSFVLDSLRGLEETIQFGQGERREDQMMERSARLSEIQRDLNRMEGSQRSFSSLAILAFSFGMLFLTLSLYQSGTMEFEGVLICTIAMMGSFGPVMALSSLSNNLNQTLASGERVLSILEEEPMVQEIGDDDSGSVCAAMRFTGAEMEDIDFSYGNEMILEHCSFEAEPGKIIGIHGPSGSGKSTILKLFMRFWDADQGRVTVSGADVKTVPTKQLRATESYVTQETHLFHDSIASNIAVGRPGASREEIMDAARKASIHEFITALPQGYDTEVGELGDTLSGGERQRIGIARAFLHDAPLLLLDEPTSNLDSLNEGIILKSLKEFCSEKTLVLVSHRKSTLGLADTTYEMKRKKPVRNRS